MSKALQSPKCIFNAALAAIACMVLAHASFAQSPQFAIVSDIDDTIKLTNVGDKDSAIYHGLFKKRAFPGMPALYTAWNERLNAPDLAPVTALSCSPQSMRGGIKEFLSLNRFPAEMEVILKNWFKFESNKNFKIRTLSERLSQTQFRYILVGDDTEYDPEVYMEIARRFPDRVQAIYIHRVNGREISRGARHFVTALEIALREKALGRISTEDVVRVGDQILEGAPEKLFPPYKLCPKDYFINGYPSGDSVIDGVVAKVTEHVRSICAKHIYDPTEGD